MFIINAINKPDISGLSAPEMDSKILDEPKKAAANAITHKAAATIANINLIWLFVIRFNFQHLFKVYVE